ncbi:MAG: hypothetical protein ACR2QU_06090 [Gammaproteobacteria bacterium]
MERLNQWLALLTNVGVLIGLIVVIYEINQNTVALGNETDVAIYTIASNVRGWKHTGARCWIPLSCSFASSGGVALTWTTLFFRKHCSAIKRSEARGVSTDQSMNRHSSTSWMGS